MREFISRTIHIMLREMGMPSELTLWIGEQKQPVKVNRSTDLVMDSVINYYKSEEATPSYRWKELFLDNGAFTARMNGSDLDRDRVIGVQERIKPDKTIPLDFPFIPGMTRHQMEESWVRTRNNILYWQESTALSDIVVPALHSWNKISLIDNVEWISDHSDADLIALGSIVTPSFQEFKGTFGDRQPSKRLVDMLSFAVANVKSNSDFGVHVMGLGSSPLMLHLAFYLGVDSIDSAGWRRKAAYGSIILPGRGEKHVSHERGVERSFGGRTHSLTADNPRYAEYISLIDECTCSICITDPQMLFRGWKARAIHNEYVMKSEAKRAKDLKSLGGGTYEKYLDHIFAKSSLQYLWEYSKRRKNYYRISELLFEG